MNKVECFKIRIHESIDPLNFDKWERIKDVYWDNLTIEPSTILADPFLFAKDGVLYMFYGNYQLLRIQFCKKTA